MDRDAHVIVVSRYSAACPDCCTEELRRIRYIYELGRREEREARAAARREERRRQEAAGSRPAQPPGAVRRALPAPREGTAGLSREGRYLNERAPVVRAALDEAVRDGDDPSIDSSSPPRDYVTPVSSHDEEAAVPPSFRTRQWPGPSSGSPHESLDPPPDFSPRAGVPPDSGSRSPEERTPPPSPAPPPGRRCRPPAVPVTMKSLPSDGSSSHVSRGTLSTASLSTRGSHGSHPAGGGAAARGGYTASLAPHPERETVPGPLPAVPGGTAGRGAGRTEPAGGTARSRSLPRIKSLASGMFPDHVGRSISFAERRGGRGATKSPRPSARPGPESRDVPKSGGRGSRSTSGGRPGGQGRGPERRRDPSGEWSSVRGFSGRSGAVAASCPDAAYC